MTDLHPHDDEHIASCSDCQTWHSMAAPDVDLERVWSGVAGEIWAGPLSGHERLLGRLLASPGLARALLTTPSLVTSWLLATIAVLATGIFFTHSTGEPWVALLAPAVAGTGIAYAYGPGVDPAFELSQSMPVSDRVVLLVRSFAVFGLNALLGLAASFLASGLTALTVTWLIPMTTVCALGLAASTLSRSANTGVVAALGCWTIIVLGGRATTQQWAAAVTANALTPFYLLTTIALTALALLVTSRQYQTRLSL
jgi:hypothetical protein